LNGHNNTVANNTAYKNNISIAVIGDNMSSSRNNTVEGNIIDDSMAGIGVSGVSYSKVEGNNISNCEGGILLADDDTLGLFDLGDTAYNTIINNNIFDSFVGIALYESGNAGVDNNTIVGNNISGMMSTGGFIAVGFTSQAGVYIDVSSGNNISNNYICTGGMDINASSISASDNGTNNTCLFSNGWTDIGSAAACTNLCSECFDGDGDGFNLTMLANASCGPVDCDDTDASVVPAIENLDVNRSLTLCPGTYFINDTDKNGVLIVSADNVTLDCNFANLTGNLSDSSIGIFSSGFDNLTIKNCIINSYEAKIDVDNANGLGIYNNTLSINATLDIFEAGAIILEDCDDASVRDNVIHTDVHGIGGVRVNSSDLSQNDITYTGFATLMIDCDYVNITENNIRDSFLGISNIGCDDCVIDGNNIQNSSSTGILGLTLSAISVSTSQRNIVSNNQIIDSHVGISITDGVFFGALASDHHQVFDNYILDTEIGILVNSSVLTVSYNNITHNDIIDSDYGIFVNDNGVGAADFNNISRNTITLSNIYGLYLNVSSGNNISSNYICYSGDTDIYVQNKDVTDVGGNNSCLTTQG